MRIVRTITGAAIAAILSLYSPSSFASDPNDLIESYSQEYSRPEDSLKLEKTKFSTRFSLSHTLEKEFEWRWTYIEDRDGNFKYDIGDDEVYYRGYPIIEFFGRIGEPNPVSIRNLDDIINDLDQRIHSDVNPLVPQLNSLKDDTLEFFTFAKQFGSAEIVKKKIELMSRSDDLMQDYQANADSLRQTINSLNLSMPDLDLDNLSVYNIPQKISQLETLFQNLESGLAAAGISLAPKLEELKENTESFASYLQGLPKDILDDAQALFEGYNDLLENYRADADQLKETISSLDLDIPKILASDVLIYGMPLDIVLDMFRDLGDFLYWEKDSNSIHAEREITAEMEVAQDTYLKQEFENRGKRFLFEHGLSLSGGAGAKVYADAQASFWKDGSMKELLRDYVNPYYVNLIPIDFNLVSAKASGEVGYDLDIDYSIGDTYQFTQLLPSGKKGFGILRVHSYNEFTHSSAGIESIADTPDLTCSLRLWESTEKYKGFDDEGMFYGFFQKDQGTLWLYGMAGVHNEYENIKIESKDKETRFILGADEGFQKEKSSIRIKENPINEELSLRGTILSGLDLGLIAPFFSLSNYPKSDLEYGAYLDNILKGTIKYDKDEHLRINGYLPIIGSNQSFKDFLRQREIILASPVFGKPTQLDLLESEEYSRIDGIFLHGTNDEDIFSGGLLLSFPRSWFLEGGYQGKHDFPSNGLYLNLGNDALSFRGSYLQWRDESTDTRSEKMDFTASGSIDDWYINLSYISESDKIEPFHKRDIRVQLSFTRPF